MKDAQIALDIARGSEAHRQVTKTSLFIMRANLEKFRFQVEMSRANNVLLKVRSDLSDTAASRGAAAKRFMAQVINSHHRAKPFVLAENRWLQENFSATAQVIIDQWSELERSLRQDVFYQPVSLDDKMEIVRALNFSEYSTHVVLLFYMLTWKQPTPAISTTVPMDIPLSSLR